MRLTISTLAIGLSAVLTAGIARADEAPSSVFTQAIIDGAASAPLANDGKFAAAIGAIRRRTGDNGPVVLFARRVVKFEQQPQCGRVAYIIGQPSAHVFYSDMSGQFNICADGDPPLRMCSGQPDKLVPPSAICADLSRPVDTPEVDAAIKAAIAAGGMTPQQAAQTVRNAHANAATPKVGARQ
jgi:hypothetical protein